MTYSLRIAAALSAVVLMGAGCFGAPTPSPSPTPSSPSPALPVVTTVGCTSKALTVLEPAANANVDLPLTVKVRVHNAEHPDCMWTVFEAQAGTMRLLDAEGVTVGTGTLTTTDDWMTTGPVEFTGTIPALSLVSGAATLVITEENPSGEGTPQEVSVPLLFP